MAHAGHVHGPTSGRTMWLSLGVTVAFCCVEAVAGYLSHSFALTSDAAHNISDALALGLAAYAIHSMKRPAAGRHMYGFHGVSALTALFNASILIVMALVIAIGSIDRFRHPQTIGGELMIWVAAVSVLMNTVIAIALSGDAKKSLNSRAAMVHMAGDAISAAGVLLAGIIVRYTGWLYADALMSLLVAGFIFWSAVGVLREASDIVMEKAPSHLIPSELADAILTADKVEGVHDLHIWTVGEGRTFLSCHVVLAQGTVLDDCSKTLAVISQMLRESFSIHHATIQPEPHGACEMTDHGSFYCLRRRLTPIPAVLITSPPESVATCQPPASWRDRQFSLVTLLSR